MKVKEHSDGASKMRLHIETPSYSWSEGKEEVPRRIVICGNHIPTGSSEICLYASGASSDALRVALTIAAMFQWMGAVSDIASAFLLAPWPSDLPRYAIHPPRVVRDSGAAEWREYWVIDRALCGLRESSAVWGSFRSKRIRGARIPFRGTILKLIPTVAEPELWRVNKPVVRHPRDVCG